MSLTKQYFKSHPYVVERHDQEDGAIHYEIWDYRSDSYRRLCTVCEDYCDDSDDGSPGRGQAKKDAEMIVRALNLNCGGLPWTAREIEMLKALKAVEEWWLNERNEPSLGAPYAIFATRAAIANAEGKT